MENKMTDETLAALLRAHPVIPASGDLARRIIAAAKPRAMRATPWHVLAELLRPAPVAAFACSLMLGIFAGQRLSPAPVPPSPHPAPGISRNAGSFLYYNGEVL